MRHTEQMLSAEISMFDVIVTTTRSRGLCKDNSSGRIKKRVRERGTEREDQIRDRVIAQILECNSNKQNS